ncbi:MAG: alpha,alpha-trehalose-phosphate synthase (UDP-forming) [Acidimicrobiales bacterium]
MLDARPVVLLSNRGPLSFSLDETGEPVAKRGAGGLVSGLTPLVAGTDAVWVAAALSEGDRVAAARGVVDAEDLRVRVLAVDPDTYRAAYDVVCNATLWFVHHGLFDAARRPRLDRRWAQAWDAYRAVNDAFADAAAETAPEGAAVLVQDYHLCLVAPRLRAARDDLRLVHFSHTPFAPPEWFRALPDAAANELLGGLAANHACTFHSQRWGDAFRACCRAFGIEPPTTGVTPLAVDLDDLDDVGSSDACVAAGGDLDARLAGRRALVRVDRVELSKNLLRGFHAYELLLEERPEWREQVVFAALVYPSREGLSEYVAYGQEVEGLVRRINERWATDTWTPVLYDTDDDFPRSVAALQRADVLLVNPIRDGLNLVAKEGMYLNQRDAVLVLSTEAGAWDELAPAGAVGVNPFDVAAQADALHEALSMPVDERAKRAASLRAVVTARRPADWLAEQLALAEPRQ